MGIGVRLPSAGLKSNLETLMTIARWAEHLGYHSVWVSDHVVLSEKVAPRYPYDADNRWPYPAPTNWFDPLLTLVWVGTAAPSVKLGASVLVMPLRNPVLLAKRISTLDYLSGGRVILGAGVGWGVHHLVLDSPLTGPDLSACWEEMQQVVEVCGLTSPELIGLSG